MAESTENSPNKEFLDDKSEAGDQNATEDQVREGTVASDQSPFEITLSEFKPDPKLINVHQFYPSLEHQFHKSASKFEEEQNKRTEDAMKEIVEESSTFALTDNEGTMVTTDVETTQDSLQIRSKGESTDGTDEDSNNSGMPGEKDILSVLTNKEGLFSTAVSEETLQKAKAKGKSIFQTEDWGAVAQYSPGMQEIVDQRAQEHFNDAMKAKEEGKFEQVLKSISKAMGLRTDPLYYVEKAEAYIQLCDFQSAILNYKKACLLDPDNVDYYSRLAFLYYFMGQTLFDQRLYPEALESFARAAEMNPDNTGYHIRSMTCLAALHRHGECLALVNKRLETDNENPDLYIMRARLHEMFRNTTLCYYDIKDAIQVDPDHQEAKAMMEKMEKRAQDNKREAMQLNLMGKHREALQKISIAIDTDPVVADFHVLRGSLHRRLGDYNAAIDDFLLALDKCEHNEESAVYIDSQRQLLLTYNDFAVECFTKGFYEEAIILLNKAIKGEKREKGLYINRGDCFFRQNDFNFALQDYCQALELDPADDNIKSRISVIYNEFGVTAYQDKNYSEAEDKLTQAIQYNPKVGQYYITRSRCRYMLENIHGARLDLIMGLLLDPTNQDVLSILSRLFPGKSIGDVVNSRAADPAKIAIRAILNIQPQKSQTKVTYDALTESGVLDSHATHSIPPKSAQTTWSQADTDVSTVEDSLVRPGGCFPPLRACMKEKDFNIKLAIEKKHVQEEVSVALKERKSLRYDGARVQPLPPPAPNPNSQKAPPPRERFIKDAFGGKQKVMTYNWRKFTMGIGLSDVKDI
ncbi:tetratricopeptide repeat protein 16-like isoform X1 [Saccostrea echinata]|uniref:tetratricopeptide repeat protein 16-like isoform X1 n=1 Tax=Saccostrea echinata TaxID=191078 RepID=UPI002A8153A0|nr:tetratricopeptide repeat protein 16-like isoform X1 [Saccostrea echinata]